MTPMQTIILLKIVALALLASTLYLAGLLWLAHNEIRFWKQEHDRAVKQALAAQVAVMRITDNIRRADGELTE